MVTLVGLNPLYISGLMVLFWNVLQHCHLLPLDRCIDYNEKCAEVLIDAVLVYREPRQVAKQLFDSPI